jgi:hypothetical protein
MNRMKFPVNLETHQGSQIQTKRFATSDGAVRIDCGQHILPKLNYPVICSVTVDATKSVPGKSTVQIGYVQNSVVFRIFDKRDVTSILTNMINITQPVYSKETVTTRDPQGLPMNVPRFSLYCPRDWVFDVVECTGHIITR